mmetsp:Transcript_10135/g.22817  ORF Transcript_10135/g.22817 Transcript_10135/m.22817 type:complete len:326 (+) Transcript_10135:224-1201(+)
MHRWAASGAFPRTIFLCACVDPAAVKTAKEFSQLYFKGAPRSLVNGFIDDRADFPNFQAQLGCQGFVIFGPGFKILEPSSAPWVEYRDQAFQAVEAKLQQILNPRKRAAENPMNAPLGQQVRIVGLQTAQGQKMNGQCGEVVSSSENGRYQVKLEQDNQVKSFRPENLEPIQTQKDAGDGGGVVSLEEGVPSVGHKEMDDQHSSCIDALKALTSKLSVESLQHVRDELAEHFEEEERLMKEAGFGGAAEDAAGATMTAYGSHVSDHRRIIAVADEALLSLQNSCKTGPGAVPHEVANTIAKFFMEHATLYDSLYEGKIASTAVAA